MSMQRDQKEGWHKVLKFKISTWSGWRSGSRASLQRNSFAAPVFVAIFSGRADSLESSVHQYVFFFFLSDMRDDRRLATRAGRAQSTYI
jgi:hypothetical protein